MKFKEAKPKIDSELAYMKWDNTKNSSVYIFYDKDNKDSLYLKYSDYKNKYLNYKKKLLMQLIQRIVNIKKIKGVTRIFY